MPLYTLYELLIYIFWLSFAKALLLHRDIQPFAEYAVAPLVGAWIETNSLVNRFAESLSHPSWVRGLKRRRCNCFNTCRSRTPRGCVD